MRAGARVLCAVAGVGLALPMCGFVQDSSQRASVDLIVTAAPVYEPLAALSGQERFPKGAQLLRVHAGNAEPLVEGFAATADANVGFDAKKVLFAGKKQADDPWQIWEMTLADRTLRQVTKGSADAIRPLYLPGGRIVFAQRTPHGSQIMSLRTDDSPTLAEVEGATTPAAFPITYGNVSALPADVLADGRVLFEAGFPLGTNGTPELFLAYADGSGVESYRCDHGAARWGGRQVASGDVVFTHGGSLARFTSRLAHEERVAAPRGEYAGGVVETGDGYWVMSARATAKEHFAIRQWKPGWAGVQTIFAQANVDLVDPVVVNERARPHHHPSALHPWDYANLLALDARQSRDGAVEGVPVTIRMETQDEQGRPVGLGSAPVETDGSFFVKVSGDRPIRMALLDAKGTVLRQEKGWFWARGGEQRICVGCHTGPERAAENRVPAVLQRTTTPVDLTEAGQTQAVAGGR